mmetsp:Transcript_15787/g.28038  ORF Transcript_15787/g.28038 Transcript_15787/m.28038 type:complete len:237 (+) Transcript_15787:391-1101(+)
MTLAMCAQRTLGCISPPSACSQSTAPQRPICATKRSSLMRRAITAPQPSVISAWFMSKSSSKSSKLLMSTALTKVAVAVFGGSCERPCSNLVWKLRAQNSAASGPGSPAEDCPSNRAYKPMGASSKIPPSGNAIFIILATLFRSLMSTCRAFGFLPPAGAPRAKASTRALGGFGGSFGPFGMFDKAVARLPAMERAICSFTFHIGKPDMPSLPPRPWPAMVPSRPPSTASPPSQQL